jgi:hypothetical protein
VVLKQGFCLSYSSDDDRLTKLIGVISVFSREHPPSSSTHASDKRVLAFSWLDRNPVHVLGLWFSVHAVLGVVIDGVKGVVVLLSLYKCGGTLVVEKFPLLL